MTGERPILFSKPMVLAILEGRKTQTRRIAKPRRKNSLLEVGSPGRPQWSDSFVFDPGNRKALLEEAPARVGETMYVREAFRFGLRYDGMKPSQVMGRAGQTVFYEADAEAETGWDGLRVGKLRPGIHMPRWCSRIERTIVDVRLERLNDCSWEDAKAEGLKWVSPTFGIPGIAETWNAHPVEAYRALWEYINGSGSWALNPRVWVIEFSPT